MVEISWTEKPTMMVEDGRRTHSDGSNGPGGIDRSLKQKQPWLNGRAQFRWRDSCCQASGCQRNGVGFFLTQVIRKTTCQVTGKMKIKNKKEKWRNFLLYLASLEKKWSNACMHACIS